MPSDLRSLLEETAARPARGPDMGTITARVRRRRRRRRGGLAALTAVVLVAAGAALGSSRQGGGDPGVRVATDGRTTTTEAGAAYGPELAIGSLSDLPDEGVAVAVDGRIVLVGLDGTVHGHVRGTFHAGPSNLLPVLAPDAGNRWLWLDPATGGVQDATAMGTPLWSGLRILHDVDTSSMLVLRGAAEPLTPVASWPEDALWWLSADHRVVTWTTCASGECPWRFLDSATGRADFLPHGCWVAAVPDGGRQTLVCADGTRLLDVAPGGGADVDVAAATGGGVARIVFGDVVRVERGGDDPGCPRVGAFRLRGDRLVPLTGTPPTAAVPLGVAADGRPVVHVTGGACGATSGRPGVHLNDPESGGLSPVWSGELPADAARMWARRPVVLG